MQLLLTISITKGNKVKESHIFEKSDDMKIKYFLKYLLSLLIRMNILKIYLLIIKAITQIYIIQMNLKMKIIA